MSQALMQNTIAYLNRAIQMVAETKHLLLPGRTIAQSPDAFRVLRDAATDYEPCGGHGWVFVFEDHSAIVTSNNQPDKIWSRWIA
jgi:hypothetical protein